MPPIRIAALSDTPAIRAALSGMLIETVAHGGSVSFMHPLAEHEANEFCRVRSPPLHAANASFSAPSTVTMWLRP